MKKRKLTEEEREHVKVLMKGFKEIYKAGNLDNMIFISDIIIENIEIFYLQELYRIIKILKNWHSAHRKEKDWYYGLINPARPIFGEHDTKSFITIIKNKIKELEPKKEK